MTHIKTHIDLLSNYLVSGKVEKVNFVGSYSRVTKSDSKKEANNLNNQGVYGLVVKETKVETISG